MERKRFYNNSITVENNIVTKSTSVKIDVDAVKLLMKENLDYVPKIISVNDNEIKYQYVEGIAVGTHLKKSKSLHEIMEVQSFVSKCWLDFHNISLRELKNKKYFYYQDLHLWNMVYSKNKFMLTDIDSFTITNKPKLNTTHSYLYSQLEDIICCTNSSQV